MNGCRVAVFDLEIRVDSVVKDLTDSGLVDSGVGYLNTHGTSFDSY